MSTPYSTVQQGISPFWRGKYEREAPRHWDAFYARNGTRFYRDRHWLDTSATDGFPSLAKASAVLECGCGAANAAFPLLAAHPRVRVFAFDFAPAAVLLVRAAEKFDKERMTAFVWDFAKEDLDVAVPDRDERGGLTEGGVDAALCLFVLSAVAPSAHADALRRVAGLLRPGGKVLFRDYCVEDLAAARFKASRRIDEHYYVRQDSTLSYFFDEEVLDAAMAKAGLVCVEARRVRRVVVNRKESKEMHRVWLQAVYEKPAGGGGGVVGGDVDTTNCSGVPASENFALTDQARAAVGPSAAKDI